MNWREKVVQSSDRVICALIAVLVLGSVLGFGGAVWWFRPVMAVAAFLLVAIKLAQSLATGRMPILKSPLGLLGLLALGLGVVQLAPLPAGLASRRRRSLRGTPAPSAPTPGWRCTHRRSPLPRRRCR